MKEFLSKANAFHLITFVFLMLGVKNTVSPDLSASLAFFSAAALLGVERYINFKKAPDINKEVLQQLDGIKTYVTAMSMKQGMKKEPIEPPKPGQRWF